MIKSVSGKFTKLIKGGASAKWGLYTFSPSRVETKKETYLVYCKIQPLPNLYTEYDVQLKESTSRNFTSKSFELISYEKNKSKKQDIFAFLKKQKLNKVTINYLKNIYENDQDQFYKDVKSNKKSLVDSISENDLKIIKNNLSFLEEEKIAIENDLYPFLEQIKKNKDLRDVSIFDFFKLNDPYLYFIYNRKVKFEDVQKLADVLEYSRDSINRKLFLLVVSLRNLENTREFSNDSLFRNKYVRNELNKLILISDEEYSDLLIYGANKEVIKWFNDKSGLYLSLVEIWEKEDFIAKKLISIKNSKKTKFTLNNYLIDKLDEDQIEAFHSCLKNNVTVVSGMPGSGKTFLIKTLAETFDENDLKNEKDYVILAPTGRAASNISIKTNHNSKTIHSFLKINDDDGELFFDYDAFDSIKILIIDEFSMVNLNIFFKLMLVLNKLEKIILIGDSHQLPSIGVGNLLADIIKSKQFPVNYLTKTHRSEFVEIFNHFKAVIEPNEIPFIDQKIVEFKNTDHTFLLENLKDLYLSKIDEYGVDNVVVLCPMYRSLNGINKINEIIQDSYNPNSELLATKKDGNSEIKFKINDKVIQVENRYEDNVFNGDMGYLRGVSCETNPKTGVAKKRFLVEFESLNGELRKVLYTETELKTQLNLAYSISVHKFQGSEIDCVIMPFIDEFSLMLNQKLIYTAVSRPKKNLSLIGDSNYYLTTINYQKQFSEETTTNFYYLLANE
ncbi:AAA family ATPase [Mycoplasmopsis ciconiae]|uniref:AAA family ATPase n=1 Tax=Mycoplasmopsis ciconiae TaxID=561067 RepID=A0ABU7MLD2_9BACT|nr:AAA family ATPase [Mycoplasmopsis ciconiae]